MTDLKDLFKRVAQLIAQGKYEELRTLKPVIPTTFNWVEQIFEQIHVAERPTAHALVWTDGVQIHEKSFKDLSDECNQMLNFLRKHGVQQQQIVYTLMGLQMQNWTTMLAVIKGGLRLVPVATIMGVNDLKYRFETMMPTVVISDTDNYQKIDEVEALLQCKVPVKILIDGTADGWLCWDVIAQESIEADAAPTKSNDALFHFFTSGTTGMPKVVVHTHSSYPVGHLTTASWIGLTNSDLHYNISQPGWAKFTWSSFFAPWNIGASIFAYHSNQRFHPLTTLQLMERHKVTTFCAPPTVLRLLIKEDLKAFQFSLRQCVAAGEPLNPEVIEAWEAGTGIVIRDGFGQTESTCLVANLPNQMVKFGSMGHATFLYDVVIADDDGNIQPDNEEGNICVKAPDGQALGLFKTFFNDEERRQKVYRNGLFYTGDKAYRDHEGYIWFIGRDDDVIKSSDYRVGPFEVENVLIEHDSVLESAVVGSPHDVKGFLVKAFVVLNKGFEPSEALAKTLFDYSRSQMAPYKIPRVIEFVTELPKTISGKIRRVELRAKEQVNKAKGIQGDHEYFY